MNKLFSVLLFCAFVSVNADPAPFGLEIGKATVDDVKKKYKTQHAGQNKYTFGDMLSIDVDEIGIEGLRSATAIFNKDNTLVAILTKFPKTKFNYLYQTMKKKKYILSKKEIPFVGNKFANFTNGNTTVYLRAPHLSFEMSLEYLDNKTEKAFQKAKSLEDQNKKKVEQEKL